MIAKLKPYPMMKDSGVEWLGEVPEHWEIKRLKDAARLIMGQSPSSEDCSTAPIGLPFLQGCAEFETSHPRSKQFCRLPPKTAPSGAILVSVRAPVGRINVADQVYGIGRGLCAVIPYPNTSHVDYTRFLMAASVHGLAIESTGSTYDAVSVGDVGCQPALLPPLPEQAAIVRYLDHVDRRVRRLTRAKRKLIALLTEQKQAIIHRAVTRGLDSDVPLKDSGLAWCPEVPEHWELKPNRAYLRQRKVLVGERHTEYTLLSLTKRGVIVRDLTDNKGKFSADMGTSQEVRSGDLVMCLFDVPETPRTVGLSEHDGMITGAYTVFELQNKQAARWLEQFYLAMDDRKALSPLYSGLRNTIPKPRFLGTKTPMPPPSEQAAIVDHLDQATADIDTAITRAERQIELLNEYRTRLIADVVTGKLDVRDAAAALPEVDPLAEDDNVDDLDADTDIDADELDEAPEVVKA